jgi:hypothetical protein
MIATKFAWAMVAFPVWLCLQRVPEVDCRLRVFDAVKTLSLEPLADCTTTATLKELNLLVSLRGERLCVAQSPFTYCWVPLCSHRQGMTYTAREVGLGRAVYVACTHAAAAVATPSTRGRVLGIEGCVCTAPVRVVFASV